MQYSIAGPGAADFLSKITPSSIANLQSHTSTLSCFLHRKTGGIIDDTVITRLDENRFYFVANAACRDKDYSFLTTELQDWNKAHPTSPVELEQLASKGLVALQGPLSQSLLQEVLDDQNSNILQALYFGQSAYMSLRISSSSPPSTSETTHALVSRAGYTGEDGFEISIPTGRETVAFTENLLRRAGSDKLRLAGLAARDSLRLEAGMCLYGHDLDDTTTPVEGGLSWIIGRDRRRLGSAGFNGDSVILQQLMLKKEGGGVQRRRIGLVTSNPAREGAKIVDLENNEIGKVTSGGPSPSTGQNIAMGYVKDGFHKAGIELGVVVRNQTRQATVTKMPFVLTKYHRVATT